MYETLSLRESLVVVFVPLLLLLSGYLVWNGEPHRRGRRVWFSVAVLGAFGVVWGTAPDPLLGGLTGVTGGLMGAMRATLEKRGVL